MTKKCRSVDISVISAIQLYFTHGCEPGSFTSRLIQGDYDGIEQYAHPLIHKYIDDHIVYVEKVLPLVCRGFENYANWEGYTNASDSVKNEINEDILADIITHNKSVLKDWLEENNG